MNLSRLLKTIFLIEFVLGLYLDLKELFKKFESKIVYNEDLKKTNWFNTGGKAKVYFKANELKDSVDFLIILEKY